VRRLLITCSRTWTDLTRARRVLGYVYGRAPDLIMVSGHAWRGDRDLERIWKDLGGQVETYVPDWEGPCSPQTCPPWDDHRVRGRNGREYCPAAGGRRNEEMARLPGVVLCLAFLMPCEKPGCEKRRALARGLGMVHCTHGARRCADYAEHEMKILTRRITPG
jgi:hypothetical protein